MKVLLYSPGFSLDRHSGSSLRPKSINKQFIANGYAVKRIVGIPKIRKQQVNIMFKRIKDGERFDYVYVENLSVPLMLSSIGIGRFKIPWLFFGDLRFLHLCIRKKIPVAYFFRDIYWKFPSAFGPGTSPWKILWTRIGGLIEISFLKMTKIQVFVPNEQFAKYLQDTFGLHATPLPPGGDIDEHAAPAPAPETKLQLFYVGSCGPLYNPEVLLRAVSHTKSKTHLTFCTRADEWNTYFGKDFAETHTTVIHQASDALADTYRRADVCVYASPPSDYIAMSFPYKISEYICMGKPIIAFEGTYPAELIRKHDLGWVVPYDQQALQDLLMRLSASSAEVAEKTKNVLQKRPQFTWEALVQDLERHLEVTPPTTNAETDLLVCPSWYPNTYSSGAGSFCKEQNELLSTHGYRVGVIHNHLVSLRDILREKKLPFLGVSKADHANVVTYQTYTIQLPTLRFRRFTRAISAYNMLAGEINITRNRSALERCFKKYAADFGLPSVAHIHSVWPARFVSTLKHRYGVPSVMTEHWSGFANPAHTTMRQRWINECYRHTSVNFAVSEALAKLVTQNTKLAVRALGNSTPFFNFREPSLKLKAKYHNDSNCPFVFLAIGNLVAIKRFDRLIKAFAAEFRGNERVVLKIAGDGILKRELQDLIKEQGVGEQVSMLGRLERSEIIELISNSQAVVSSSSYETFGMTIIEAMALGTPVIAVNRGGPAEILTNCGTGILALDCQASIQYALHTMFQDFEVYNQPKSISMAAENLYSDASIVMKLSEAYIRAQSFVTASELNLSGLSYRNALIAHEVIRRLGQTGSLQLDIFQPHHKSPIGQVIKEKGAADTVRVALFLDFFEEPMTQSELLQTAKTLCSQTYARHLFVFKDDLEDQHSGSLGYRLSGFQTAASLIENNLNATVMLDKLETNLNFIVLECQN